MKAPITIIIPTWNLPEYFNPCIKSIIQTGILGGLANIIVVNNGDQPIKEQLREYPQIKVLKPEKNIGWEGGLKLALENTDSQFVVFQNDDTFIPKSSNLIYQRLLTPFIDKSVSIVSPVTTVASGAQSVFSPNCPRTITEVSHLIFFTVMARRQDIMDAGGIDTTLPGGDDLDMSIRLRKMGKHLLINPDAFLIHHGFKSGTRLRGDGYAGVKNGWNSPEMIENVAHALIRKHGFKTYVEMLQGLDYGVHQPTFDDLEGDIVRSFIQGEKIIELGVGGQKTVPGSIGVDRVCKGEDINFVPNVKSVSDVTADVQQKLPFPEFSQDTVVARHILEHCLDSIKTISHWNNVLKEKGRLIVAVPDEDITNGIPMNPEHVHAYNEESLQNIMKACGFKTVEIKPCQNGVSFVGCFEKVEHMNGKY